jgi:pimeloyl-ACP methyl ester carboxylesterase
MCTKRALLIATSAALALLTLAACRKVATWSDPSPHKNGFVTASGIRINYLDWGGSGPTLILIHGYGDNPHVFDDIAPAFTDRFRVIAYARRGQGDSEAKEPYDAGTMAEDLHGLMDALHIAKAHLAGWSMAGNDITAMAGAHPERVDRMVYLGRPRDAEERHHPGRAQSGATRCSRLHVPL